MEGIPRPNTTTKTTVITGFVSTVLPSAVFVLSALNNGNFNLYVPVVAVAPVLIALAPVLFLRTRFRRISSGISGIGLMVFIAMFMFTSGRVWFYAPAAAAMLLAFVGEPPDDAHELPPATSNEDEFWNQRL